MGTERQDDIMLYLQILGIRKVLDMEEILHLLHACLSQVDDLVLLIDDKVSRLLLHHSHDGIHLGKLLHILAPVHPARQQIAHLIKGGGLTALAGNDKRCPGFIDQYRVYLVNDTEMHSPQNQLFLVDNHIIAQIVKSQFIIGHISNVALICLLALLGSHTVQNHTHGESQEFVNLSHPFRVTLCQIVIDRDHMYAFSFQSI